MMQLSRVARSSRYTPIVGCAFLVETLYGSKYSANLGAYNMPYVYVKTILLCATGHGLELREGRYMHGLIELLLPSKVSQDNLTKLELLQFVDAIPMDRMLEGQEAESEEEAEVQATMALMAGSSPADPPPRQRAHTYHPQRPSTGSSSHTIFTRDDTNEDESGLTRPSKESPAATQRRRQQEQEEEDAAAIESIMSFVSPATFPSSMARVLVYDAVCTCVADGLYSAKEKERVALVSSHIGLSTAVRGQIEKLALQEKVLSIRKRRLLLLQKPPLSHTPLEAEQHRQLTNELSHTSRYDEDRGKDAQHHQQHGCSDGWSSAGPAGVMRDGVVEVAGRSQGPQHANSGGEDGEEVKRIEAAKALLRRARRRQQRQKYFAAGE